MTDEHGALLLGPDVLVAGAATGHLAGRTFVAKDLFDVAGLPTGAGNPAWLETHEPPSTTATAVQRLLDAGADLIGKSHTDELAYSLSGTNAHYGMPRNPAAPGRIPGGSSSGSAVAVAAGIADLALGTDTGGSVRIPASYCGIAGFRPTHGRVPVDGVVPLAASFDAVGWFTREASLLAMIGGVLLGPGSTTDARTPSAVLTAGDTLAAADVRTVEALTGALRVAESLGGEHHHVEHLAPIGLDRWRDTFRVLQGREAWEAHGEWIHRARPRFGPGIEGRFDMARTVTDEQVAAALPVREDVRRRVVELLGPDRLLALPAAPGPAPPATADGEAARASRIPVLRLTCAASLAGAPAAVVPAAVVGGGPVGVCLLGAPGADELVLATAVTLAAALGDGTG